MNDTTIYEYFILKKIKTYEMIYNTLTLEYDKTKISITIETLKEVYHDLKYLNSCEQTKRPYNKRKEAQK